MVKGKIRERRCRKERAIGNCPVVSHAHKRQTALLEAK
jgi:hypothetical protein